METANRRITAQDMSQLPRYAEGGLIGGIKAKLFGKPETITEKFARQDAERAAKAAKATPPPAPVPAPAPNTAIGQYAGGTALDNRMKAVGLKKGGKVRGSGTGTSDDVPIMGSNGEFMVKAKAVNKLGLPFMNMINEIADGGKEEAGDAKEQKAPEHHMKKGGAVRCMAEGGFIDEPSRIRALVPIPGTGDNGYRPNFTLPKGAPVRGPAPAAVPPASQAGPTMGQRMTKGLQQFTGVNGSSGVGSKVMGALGRLGAGTTKLAGRLAAPAAVLHEGSEIYQVAADPNASKVDVATQVAQTAGRLSTAGLGAAAGAAMGSVVPVVGTALGGLVGGALGYYGADKAIEAGRTALGVDPRSPAQQSTAREQLAAVPTAAPKPAVTQPSSPVLTGGPGRPQGTVAEQVPLPVQRPAVNYYPAGSAAAREAGRRMDSGAAYIPASGEGMIRHEGSGAVTELRTAPQTMAAPSQAMLQRTYAPAENAGANKWIADQEQSMRDLRSSKAGASAGPGFVDEVNAKRRANAAQKLGAVRDANDLQAATTRRGQDLLADSNTATHQLAQQRLSLDTQTHGLENDSKAQVLSAQAQLASAATPAQRLAAEDQLRALQGKYGREAPPVRHLVVPGGQAVSPDGQVYTTPARVFNPDTQQFIEPPQPGQQAASFEKGKVYKDAKGNRATWDGQKFVPTK